MTGYPDLTIPFLLGLQIVFLILLGRFVLNLPDWRYRVLVPFAATILDICAMSQLDGIIFETTIGGIIIVALPTLSVLTVFPFAESYQEIKNRRMLVFLISIPLTIMLLFYLWAWNFSSIPTLFLPVGSLIPATGRLFLLKELLVMYGEMLIICGTLTGALVLVLSYGITNCPETGLSCSGGQVALLILLGIGSIVFNSLVVGFLTIFLYLVLRTVPSRAMQTAIVVLFAGGIMAVTSLMPVVKVYSERATAPYDFTLFALLLLALGTVTLFPVIQQFFKMKEMPALYFCSTVTVTVLALLFHDPAADLFGILARGLSTITDSGVFAVGPPFADRMVNELILFGSAVIVSGIAYAALAVVLPRFRKQEGRPSAIPVPETLPDHTSGSKGPDPAGPAGRREETKPEETDRTGWIG
jgi:hypothetical protein